jgi:NADPH:quinone reductase-like Zn-dependent oxidoreductase
MGTRARVLTSTWQGNGELVVELATRDLPEPTGRQVLVRVEAAPINPSDLGVLFGRADLARARFEPGRIVARMIDETAPPTFAKRVDLPIGCGNEGAGTVIAAGEAPEAQALLGRTVSGMGQMYASHRLVDAGTCMPLPEGMAAEAGAAAFVNPMTALAFVETMRAEGCEALLHTAAASNLGQMLVRVCAEDGVPLINVVRSPAQAELLRGMGARWVLDSTAPGYFDDLVAAIRETGLPLAFDAIGGGTQAATIFSAMEAVAGADIPYSPYGSYQRKKVRIYGMLDPAPTVLERSFGFSWELSGFILPEFLGTAGPERLGQMRARITAGLGTTFASRFGTRVPLDQMLERDQVLAYARMQTGHKALVVPGA